MPKSVTKYLVVGLIVLLAVFLDQWSKYWAENNLASWPFPDHAVTKTVSLPDDAGVTLEDYIATKYPKNDPDSRRMILSGATRNGLSLAPGDTLHDGDELSLKYATITVIPGYYDYQYARNKGAAWSFMADKPDGLRKVFFGITGVIARFAVRLHRQKLLAQAAPPHSDTRMRVGRCHRQHHRPFPTWLCDGLHLLAYRLALLADVQHCRCVCDGRCRLPDHRDACASPG